MRYVIYKCNRCGSEARMRQDAGSAENDSILMGWLLDVVLPIPTGHITRTDCFSAQSVDICKECHSEFRHWYTRMPKEES